MEHEYIPFRKIVAVLSFGPEYEGRTEWAHEMPAFLLGALESTISAWGVEGVYLAHKVEFQVRYDGPPCMIRTMIEDSDTLAVADALLGMLVMWLLDQWLEHMGEMHGFVPLDMVAVIPAEMLTTPTLPKSPR